MNQVAIGGPGHELEIKVNVGRKHSCSCFCLIGMSGSGSDTIFLSFGCLDHGRGWKRR